MGFIQCKSTPTAQPLLSGVNSAALSKVQIFTLNWVNATIDNANQNLETVKVG